VLALEDSALDVDQVENLIKFCPTKEEIELLKVWANYYVVIGVIFIIWYLSANISLPLKEPGPSRWYLHWFFLIIIVFMFLCSGLHRTKGKVREMWTGV